MLLECKSYHTYTTKDGYFYYFKKRGRGDNNKNAIFFNVGTPQTAILEWSYGTCYIFDDNNSSASYAAGWSTDTVIRAYVIDRTANLFRVYENGTQLGTASISSLTGSITFNGMFNWGNGTSLPGQIDHGITLLYRGLHDATDVGTVSDWLNSYYGDLIY